MNDLHSECLRQNVFGDVHGYLLFYSISLFFLNFLDISIWRADSHATHMNFVEISVLVQTSMFLTSSLNSDRRAVEPGVEPPSH